MSEALDHEMQGDCWPDPVAWDGRPMTEQADDLLRLAESREEFAPGVASAVDFMRRALARARGES